MNKYDYLLGEIKTVNNRYIPLINNIAIILGGGSSSSMGDNGALTGLTALAHTYNKGCYLYMPTGAIEEGSAAGFYYTIMSSTTAGTVYNNVYIPGTPPVIPSSPTAFVTTGPGTFTQTTSEITLASYTLPANGIGVNGRLEIDTSHYFVNSGNNKVIKHKFGGNNYFTFTRTGSGTLAERHLYGIRARGRADSQYIDYYPTSKGNYNTLIAIDTTSAKDFIITGTLANAADWLSLEHCSAEVIIP